MANFFTDNQDLQYYIDTAIDWEPLVRISEYEYGTEDGFKNAVEAKEFYKETLDLVGGLIADELAPVAAKMDEEASKFKDGKVLQPESMMRVFEKIKEMGLHGMCVPRELGGMNFPVITYMIASEIIARGDSASMTHFGFHQGIALALTMYSVVEGSLSFQVEPPKITKMRFEKEVAEIISGEAWGSMDITEPGAGSDMAALRCSGTQDKDGNWVLNGQKIFITSGHAKYHIVIAKTENSKSKDDAFGGLKNLSLFLVTAYEEKADGTRKVFARVDGIEKKLGIKASATCSISYEDTPAKLIGNRGEGFKLMLLLMNNARIGVGFEAIGLSESAYRMAKDYAAERPSMGKMIDKHEMIADYLEGMQTDIQGMRAMAMKAAFHEEMTQKLRIKLVAIIGENHPERKKVEKQRKYHEKVSRSLTPLLKYWAAEKSVEIARKNVQIHGGFGYSKEYGAEKLLRDSVILPIYEGTSQIQSLMAMKDALFGVIKKPKKFFQDMLEARTKSLTAPTSLERRVAALEVECHRAIQNLMSRVAVSKLGTLKKVPMKGWVNAFTKDWDPKNDFAPAMLHAEKLTIMLAQKEIAKALLEQVQKDKSRKDVLIRFLEKAEPNVEYMRKQICTTGDRLIKKMSLDTIS